MDWFLQYLLQFPKIFSSVIEYMQYLKLSNSYGFLPQPFFQQIPKPLPTISRGSQGSIVEKESRVVTIRSKQFRADVKNKYHSYPPFSRCLGWLIEAIIQGVHPLSAPMERLHINDAKTHVLPYLTDTSCRSFVRKDIFGWNRFWLGPFFKEAADYQRNGGNNGTLEGGKVNDLAIFFRVLEAARFRFLLIFVRLRLKHWKRNWFVVLWHFIQLSSMRRCSARNYQQQTNHLWNNYSYNSVRCSLSVNNQKRGGILNVSCGERKQIWNWIFAENEIRWFLT